MSKHKTENLPYMKAILTTLTIAWIVAAITSGFVLNIVVESLTAYATRVSVYGYWTISVAILLSLLVLGTFIYRELRIYRSLQVEASAKALKQEHNALETLATEYQV